MKPLSSCIPFRPKLMLGMVGCALMLAAAPAALGQGGSMREMMREMMRGAVPPPGMSPETLPEPDSEGAGLLLRYCVQCHDPPSPRYKTAGQWPEVFERMNARMRMMSRGMMGGGMMGMHRMEAPNLSDARTLLAYLIRNSMTPARPEELAVGPPADRPVFGTACADCHALPSPRLHPPGEWPSVVARMDANRRQMDKPELTPEDRAAVLRFLLAASGALLK